MFTNSQWAKAVEEHDRQDKDKDKSWTVMDRIHLVASVSKNQVDQRTCYWGLRNTSQSKNSSCWGGFCQESDDIVFLSSIHEMLAILGISVKLKD